MDTDTISNFELMRLIRDAGCTHNAERQMLDALALRCTPSKGYVCWPSYSRLAADTGLSLATLRKAARGLEGKDLIRRKVRMDRSNLWWIHVPQLIKLRDERLAAAAEEVETEEHKSPFDTALPDSYNADADGDWMPGGAL